jgi:hypothetical protein
VKLSFALVSAFPLVVLSPVVSCSRFGAVYPPRPAPADAPPVSDPAPSKMVAHLSITAAGLRDALDANVPTKGEGSVRLLGGDRTYTWEREPLDVSMAQGRVLLQTRVHATLALPLKRLQFPLDLHVGGEPVIGADYSVKLQGTEVTVRSPDRTLAFADEVAGVYGRIEDPIREQLKAFRYDLRPLLSQAYDRVGAPIMLPIGDASACATLKVLEVEAAPTVMADGIEKDVALVVAPSIAMPCPALAEPERDTLPPLSNVASLTPGPFTVTVPVAARYEELTRAMTMAFTDGKLFFSKDSPQVYLENPELYESGGVLVLKLHIAGPVHAMGIDTVLDGDLFLSGHPTVVDNELSLPDLEPTIETKNFLLSLKALADGDRIRDQARAALRLDIGARVKEARDKLGDALTFSGGGGDGGGGGNGGCFQGNVDRIEVTGVYPHAGYLRVYIAVTGRARADVPCR